MLLASQNLEDFNQEGIRELTKPLFAIPPHQFLFNPGSIGKRYRREDEIGTPYCITVDFDTVGDADKAGDNCVTVRDRDTMEQVRLPIDQLKSYLAEKLAY